MRNCACGVETLWRGSVAQARQRFDGDEGAAAGCILVRELKAPLGDGPAAGRDPLSARRRRLLTQLDLQHGRQRVNAAISRTRRRRPAHPGFDT